MNFDHCSLEEIKDYQLKKLSELTEHFKKVPFLTERLRDFKKIDENNIVDIPIMKKEDLRRFSPYERTAKGSQTMKSLFSSSGTTGKPSIYAWGKNDDRILEKSAKRCMSRVGINENDLIALITSTGTGIMWYCFFQQYQPMDATTILLGTPPLEDLYYFFINYPISVVTSLPTFGSLFEYYIRKKQLPMDKIPFNFRQFHCGGDFLSDARRQRIEDFFSVDVYDFYGISEIFGPIFGECPEKQGFHMNNDLVLVEVLDPFIKEPVKPGELGVFVYTTLWNKLSPLLRYWSNDYGYIINEECKCGRKSPRLFLKGRPENMIIDKEKKDILFIKDVENILLKHPDVFSEYKCILHGQKDLKIQCALNSPNCELDKELIIKELELIKNYNYEIQISDLTFEFGKPTRLIEKEDTFG